MAQDLVARELLEDGVSLWEMILNPGITPSAKQQATLAIAHKWRRAFKIDIPYIPDRLETWIINRVVRGVADALIEFAAQYHAKLRRMRPPEPAEAVTAPGRKLPYPPGYAGSDAVRAN